MKYSEQSALLQGSLDDNVLDCIEDCLDVSLIRGARDVCVDGSSSDGVLTVEKANHKLCRLLEVSFRALVLREVLLHRNLLQLLLEQIPLVQEENEGCLCKPTRAENVLEDLDSLLHPVDTIILEETQIIIAQRRNEQHCRDVFETVNPFLSFVSLTTDIKHTEIVALDGERLLDDSSGADTHVHHIVNRGEIVRQMDSIEALEEIVCIIHQLILVSLLVGCLNAGILP